MIDTDKYEGHTEGEWMLDYRDWNWAINIFGKDGETIEANAILIQDAPLLLQEVKRLREMMDVLASFHIVKNVEQGFTQREWVELVELVKRGEEE